MKRLALVAALVSVQAALAACDTLAVRTVGGPTFLYKSGDLQYAGGDRELRVVVPEDRNILFGNHALTEKAVISGLQSGVGRTTRFSVAPTNYNNDFKVVVMINPASKTKGEELCQEPKDYRSDSLIGEIHVLAVFCRVNDVLTEIDGYAPGNDHEQLAALMKIVARDLFPNRDLGVGDTPE